MNWYYLKNRQCVGPVSAGEIIRLVREGELLRSDRVRYGAYGPWLAVSKVPTLRPVAQSTRAKPAATGPNTAPGYFAAHWRGLLPLSQSFWLNSFLPLVLLSLGFFAAVFGSFPVVDVPPWRFAAIFAALAMLLLPWQFIGAWRSAERRNREREDPLATAACFGLAVLAAQWFGLLTWSVPFFESAMHPQQVLSTAPAARIAAPAAKTKPAKPSAAAVTTTPESIEDSALKRLAEIEPFATLRTHAPQQYATAQDLVSRAIAQGETEQAALARTAGLIPKLAEHYMPLAPDEAISAYVAVLLRELQALQAKSPTLCARFAYPQGGETVRVGEHVDSGLLEAERDSLIQLVSLAAASPGSHAEFKDVEKELVGVYRRIAARHGPGIYKLDQPYTAGFDDAQLCQITIDIYAEFQSLPLAERGKVLRFTLGS
ncbi:MAG: DUF4339 domain-containing protein [Nevskiales bacterium]